MSVVLDFGGFLPYLGVFGGRLGGYSLDVAWMWLGCGFLYIFLLRWCFCWVFLVEVACFENVGCF